MKTRLLFYKNIVFVVSKKLYCHRTPTEVHMYSDRGTHVLRPRYACIPTEVRIHPDRNETTFKNILHYAHSLTSNSCYKKFLHNTQKKIVSIVV